MDDLVLLAAALRLSPADLFKGADREVRVKALVVAGDELPRLLDDPAAVVDHAKRTATLAENLRHEAETLLRRAGVKPTSKKVAAIASAASRQAEREAARRIGVPPVVVAALAVALWGRSLTDQRDRLADEEAAGMELSWVTRRLLAELEERGRAVGLIEEP